MPLSRCHRDRLLWDAQPNEHGIYTSGRVTPLVTVFPSGHDGLDPMATDGPKRRKAGPCFLVGPERLGLSLHRYRAMIAFRISSGDAIMCRCSIPCPVPSTWIVPKPKM